MQDLGSAVPAIGKHTTKNLPDDKISHNLKLPLIHQDSLSSRIEQNMWLF
jgi:hypothetical protein